MERFSWMDIPSSENVHLGFYFADLIFVVFQSTAKTMKIGSLENLYGIFNVVSYIPVYCTCLGYIIKSREYHIENNTCIHFVCCFYIFRF